MKYIGFVELSTFSTFLIIIIINIYINKNIYFGGKLTSPTMMSVETLKNYNEKKQIQFRAGGLRLLWSSQNIFAPH